MKIYKKRVDLIPFLDQLRENGITIGFVPTMGALHAGHISLIEASRSQCGLTICSIFVNPTQFNDPKDLKKYPRPLEKDIEILLDAGCDILYLPEVEDIYPGGTFTKSKFRPGNLGKILEGASRQGHFQGVMQVVAILLEITRPNRLFLGQKDFQQFLILRKLVEEMKISTTVVQCPIVREAHGLAMSSRNVRLPNTLRKKAGIIYQTLQKSAGLTTQLRPKEIEAQAKKMINKNKGFRVDYFDVRDAETLKSVTKMVKGKTYILITSVIVGGVRLLDNVLVGKQDK